MSPKGGLAKRLALLLVSTLFAVLLAEVGLRCFAPQPPSWLSVYSTRAAPLYYGLREGARQVVDTGETKWTVLVDGMGFRFGGKATDPNRKDLLVLGDSFAFGWGVDYEDSFADIVQRNAAGGPRVIDAGVPGYGPIQYRAMLEDCLGRLPNVEEVCVVLYLGNDFQDCVWNKNLPVVDGALGGETSLRATLKQHSHLYRLLSRTWHVLMTSRQPLATRDPVRELFTPAAWNGELLTKARAVFERECAAIHALCASRQLRLRFVLIPVEESVHPQRDDGHAADQDPTLPATVANGILRGIGAPVLDLTARFAASPAGLYFPIDRHLTQQGNRLVAQAIAESK